MSLDNEFEAAFRVRRQPCKVRSVYEGMDATDREALVRVVDNYDFPLQVISEVLAGRGIQLSTDTLRKHRSGRCSCESGR